MFFSGNIVKWFKFWENSALVKRKYMARGCREIITDSYQIQSLWQTYGIAHDPWIYLSNKKNTLVLHFIAKVFL